MIRTVLALGGLALTVAQDNSSSSEIQNRFADLSGCGQYKTCPVCTGNQACAWSASGCTLKAVMGSPQQYCSPVPQPSTVKQPCSAYPDCNSCTSTAGCIWFRGSCAYSQGTGCLSDPTNCVNYAWQCPAPGVPSGYNPGYPTPPPPGYPSYPGYPGSYPGYNPSSYPGYNPSSYPGSYSGYPYSSSYPSYPGYPSSPYSSYPTSPYTSADTYGSYNGNYYGSSTSGSNIVPVPVPTSSTPPYTNYPAGYGSYPSGYYGNGYYSSTSGYYNGGYSYPGYGGSSYVPPPPPPTYPPSPVPGYSNSGGSNVALVEVPASG